MAEKGRTSINIAVIGQVTDDFQVPLRKLGGLRFFTGSQLASLSAETLTHFHLLVIGAEVDVNTLSMWLPSLRTANPTMSVVGIGDETTSKGMGNWVDELCPTPEELNAYLDLYVPLDRFPRSINLLLSMAKKVGVQVLIFSGLLALWWSAVLIFEPPKFLLPSPIQVAESFWGQWDRFLMHLLTTAKEAILGFLLGNTLGIGLAVLLHRYLHLQKWTMPVLISFQAIPIVAFAPLLSVWLGTGLASKIAMAAIICFFPMVVNSLVAFSTVEKEFLELFKLFRASYGMEFRRLLLPASAPTIIAALKISAGLSVVGAIVAEMTGANKGLGYLLLNGAYRLETDLMFVAMLLSGVLGVVFFHMPEIVRLFLPRTWGQGLAAETFKEK
jgi:ABC-type nitrate/sulfonate/bicarbonate transport system permease component